jgi:hypothetical protein
MIKRLLISLAMAGALVGATAPTPAYWPSSPRIPTKLQQSVARFDGGTVRNTRGNINGSTVELSYLGAFAPSAQTERWSITLALPSQPRVKLGVTNFRPGEFLSDLTAEQLASYIAGLQAKGATAVQSSLEGTLETEAAIFGQRPVEVRYTMADESVVEFIVKAEGKIWFFGYSAPSKSFEAQLENVLLILARARLIAAR